MSEPECTVSVRPGGEALRDALKTAPDDAIVCIAPGTYEGSFLLERSLTLRATGDGVVLDADGRGPVLSVAADKLSVTLEGLILTGGSFGAGGVLPLEVRSEVTFVGCTLRGNETGDYGGGALYARRGKIVLKDSVVENNEGKWGGAILADGVSVWEIQGTTIRGNRGVRGGALAIRDGARVTVDSCQIEGNTATDGGGAQVYVAGTTTRGPEVAISGTILDEIHDSMGNATIVRK